MFGFWEPFVLLGGMFFWIVMAGLFAAFVWCVEIEKGAPAFWVTVVTVLFFWGAVGLNPIMYAWNNPITTTLYVVASCGGGVIWSVIKWYFYLLRRRDEAREIRKWFNANQGDIQTDWAKNNTDPLTFEAWMNAGYSGSGKHRCDTIYYDRSYPPQSIEHKGDILFWMAYWPFSAFWTLLNDPIRRAWREIYKVMGNVLQRISNKMFADV